VNVPIVVAADGQAVCHADLLISMAAIRQYGLESAFAALACSHE
jgi:hypothetical protein